jgi:endonuclease/exonuclease/phosphatase (EEP) superfamily protein YafD
LKKDGVPVFIGGDFNVNYRRDSVVRANIFPYAKMNTVDAWANWRYLGAPDSGTIGDGNRVIDYVFATRNSKVTPVSTRVLPTYGSDHHAIQFVVRVK